MQSRASPRVYQILLGKFCVLPTFKKICQVKKSSSPIVWHHSLAKPRYYLHQKLEREIKLCLCPSISWKLTSGTLRQKQNYFYVLPSLLIRTDAPRIRAHIYTRGGSFSELGINGNLGWGTVGESFFCFCQKKMTAWDGELLEML